MVWNSIIWWYVAPVALLAVLVVGAWLVLRFRDATEPSELDPEGDEVLGKYQ